VAVGGTSDVTATPLRSEGAAALSRNRSRVVDGGAFVFDEPADVPAAWGEGQAVAWAEGEPLLLVGPDGVGKTTVQQQLLLARAGLRDRIFGLPVKPAERRILYVAADRPRQAARSLRRMVDESDRQALEERLTVWKGPLPFDVAAEPGKLALFAAHHDASDLFIDALKDIALDLSKDETGSRLSRAFQEVVAAGIELCGSHHQRKEQQGRGAGKPTKLADVFGSRWITAGAGSVLLLWGEPGDLVIDLTHLKQPSEDVGPFQVRHDHRTGTSSVFNPLDLEALIGSTLGGLSVREAASAIFGKEKPTPNEVEKARRRLESLVANGIAERREILGAAHYFPRAA
jgi:replicative DNA helicase